MTQQELNRIVHDVHNEYGGKGKIKEISIISQRAGISRREAKQALDNFGMKPGEWEKMGLWKKSDEEIAQEQRQRDIEQQRRLMKQQEKVIRNMAKCPRCGSTSISYDTKKLSIGRAIVGDAIAGPTGAILGGLSSKKGYGVCLKCGKRWKL
ncbi:hypothetical protein [uncultured Eubacterium sp.]|uniref:hypothetical protein n=1 Tax=uncultured Eubacterium sp. TaxID=165185 RepID=UPI003267B8D4